MEGIEFVSGVIIDTVMRDLSPDTDVRVVLGAPAPSAMTSSPVPEASSGRAAAPSPSPGYETPAKGKYRQRY